MHVICVQVISSTSDKASPNQRLYRLHRAVGEQFAYRAINHFAGEQRYLYFFSDVPHIVKTLRNNLSSSRESGTRCLWVSKIFSKFHEETFCIYFHMTQNDGQHLWWSHVFRVYQDDFQRELHRTKLSYDHVNLTPATKMNVRLAAQVFRDLQSKN